MKINLAPKLFKIISLCWLMFLYIISNDVNAKTATHTQLKIGASIIELTFAPGAGDKNFALGHDQIIQWIEKSAFAVADYFQGFPVKNLNIAINPSTRSRINGIAYHGEIPLIVLSINTNTSTAGLQRDWVLVHEMVHLAFPPIRQRHHWIEEGLATYVEPLVRVRAGIMSNKEAWSWFLKGMPHGLPAAGDRGLDFTPTWGRTYWGGAIYFLLADMQIRQQSNNRFGLEHALRAIKNSGGNMQLEQTWPVMKTLKIGDQATGTTVLVALYEQMKNKAVMTDLDAIWKNLGVSLRNNQIVYDNNAPEAALRRALVSQKK